MQRTEAQQLGDIINTFMKKQHLDVRMLEQQASYIWPDIVGYGINRYTIARSVSGGIMTIRMSSSTLRNELMMHRSTLIARLNEALGADIIKDIILK